MFEEMNDLNLVLLILIGCINLYTFILYFVDKRRAIDRKYRISEKNLLLSSFAFGGIGAWLGMKIFRHKTQHALFKFSLPIAALFTLLAIYLLLQFNITTAIV